MKHVELLIEKIVLASRWLLVVFYLGLALGLALFSLSFLKMLVEFLVEFAHLAENESILRILSLIDATLVASLLVMVIIAGYENFVSKFDEKSAELSWMGKIDYASLKIKVASTIVAISSIHLLQVFLNIDSISETKVMWLTIMHMAFIISALLLALMDRIGPSHDESYTNSSKPAHAPEAGDNEKHKTVASPLPLQKRPPLSIPPLPRKPTEPGQH